MRGLISDANIEGHFRLLIEILELGPLREIWLSLNLSAETFRSLGIARNVADSILWETCQREQLILVTANRNADGPDSLEVSIRKGNAPNCLPVFTLADPDRVIHSDDYARLVAERMLERLTEIDHFRGAGRIYLP